MVHDLVDELCRRAASVTDPALRAQLFRARLAALPVEELRLVLETLIERAGLRSHDAQVALLSVAVALALDFPRMQQVYDAALAPPPSADDALCARCEAPEEAPEEEGPVRVPDYGMGRVPSLGERKSLARRPDRRTLDRALRDPHPGVIALLLHNPRLTEADVVRLCARRPGVPEVLLQVFQAARWAVSPRVRSALALNPATPAPIVATLAPLLHTVELRALAADPRAAPLVRRRCLEVLARLPPHPEAPTSTLH